MNNKKEIQFQVLDWSPFHKETFDGRKKFTIRLFGMTDEKKRINVEVTNFTPYFYVEIPDRWTEVHVAALLNAVRNKIPATYRENPVKTSIVKRYKFWGFTAKKLFNFARFIFEDHDTFRKYQWAFDREITISQIGIRQMKFQLYEANIEPLIRCMHTRNLQACGWIKIAGEGYTHVPEDEIETPCDINIRAKYTELDLLEGKESDIQPFTVAAFDIECVSGDGSFPQPTRDSDKIIMIATTFSRFGEGNCYYRNVIVLGSCGKIEGADVIQCETEEEVLEEWSKMIRKKDPDFITGWRIFGFDEVYIYERCKKLNILPKVSRLSRVTNEQSKFETKELASSALGDNILHYFNMVGRVHFDLMKVVQKDFKLGSYKLDSVASTFFREIVLNFSESDDNKNIVVETKGTYGLRPGRYVTIVHNDGITDYEHLNGKKFKILKIEKNKITLEGLFEFKSLVEYLTNPKHKIFLCRVKDDVKPREIFTKFNGTTEDRTELAEYNIQDCELCNELTSKLNVLDSNMSMANVCNVPLSYLFMRGQGVKVFSLVSKKCRQRNYLIPVIQKKKKKDLSVDETKWDKHFSSIINSINKVKVVGDADDDDDTGFEGAIVFDPIPGLYRSPIYVLDYASLYPNSMRFRGLSHECIVIDDKYKNLSEYEYVTITYNNNDENKTPAPPCMFAKCKDGSLGILPEILVDLLDARARTRKLIETITDPFKKKILDGLQLAYKITANSLYGQTGAPTSPIFMKEIAACTTATGRDMLKYSRTFIEEIFDKLINLAVNGNYGDYMEYAEKVFGYVEHFNYEPIEKSFKYAFDDCEPDKQGQSHGIKRLCKLHIPAKMLPVTDWKKAFCCALRKKTKEFMGGYSVKHKVIYGDTDSVFVDPHITCDEDKKLQTDKSALEKGMRLGILASMCICILLPEPMRQEYEKTMWPLALISKKRYVGNLYTDNVNKYEQKSMGIVLKRRDNAQIVKIVCGGIVDQLLNHSEPRGAINFTRSTLIKILSEQYPIDKFIVTKTLRENYKKRESIAHAVLADRMASRDPGNKPLSNDRIPYVFTVQTGKVKLQGDRIETPDYVQQNKLKVDYLYYVTNQIMKPAIQFLGLITKNPEKIFTFFITNEENKRKGIHFVKPQRSISYYTDIE